MRIQVADIPEEGLAVEGVAALGQPFADPTWRLAALSLRLLRDGEVVLVRGRLEARVPQVCGRCLERYEVVVAPEVDTRFVPMPRGRAEEVELGADDLETDLYDGIAIDLGLLVETETTLGLPMKPLCRQGCRGLCPICGGNRNLVPCACQAPSTDPRWAPLARLAGRLSR